jgi:hypothetical protein
MKATIRTPRGPLVIMLALLAALLIAACGGSSNSGGSSSKNASKTTTTTTTAKSASASRTALAACLKKNGVTIGTRGAGGFRFRGGTTTNGTSTTGAPPQGGGLPGGGSSSGHGTPPSGAAGGGFPGGRAGGFAGRNSKFAKAFATCSKQLGIKAGAGFGAGGFGGAGRFRGGAGGTGGTPRLSTATLKSYVACIRKNGYAAMPEPKASSNGSFFPRSVETNAKFKTANKKCESILLKAFRSFRPGARGGGGTSTISGTSTVSSA